MIFFQETIFIAKLKNTERSLEQLRVEDFVIYQKIQEISILNLV